MVALPAFKFLFLAIRQVTRPVARQIVERANTKRALTYRMCIGLGRFSLGLSGVISEWSRAEEQKQREAKKKSEEAQRAKAAETAEAEALKAAETAKKAAAAAMDAVGGQAAKSEATTAAAAAPKAATATSDTTAAKKPPAAAAAPKETPATASAATVIPRSRSLLQSVVYGPQLKDSPADSYDSTVFLDPSRTVGEAARVFIRYPARSSWDVFRQTFLAPFPEDRLVTAGADLLIELVAYTILCTMLIVEILQQSRTTAAKEAHVNARLEAIESKLNELIEHNNESFAYPPVEELPPVPELHVTGRLGALWGAVTSGASMVGSTFAGDDDSAEELERMTQSGKVVAPRRDVGANLARAPPRDPAVKVSKHDETEVIQVELSKLLRSVGSEKRA